MEGTHCATLVLQMNCYFEWFALAIVEDGTAIGNL